MTAPGAPLHFFPDYSSGNPYQTMLHSQLDEVGAYPVPVPDLIDHLVSRAAGPADPGLLALHWTSPILGRADGPFRAKLLLDGFRTALDDFRAAGGRLAWTVHNVLPHETGRRWAEIELAQMIADRADLIHVLSEETVDAVAGRYRLDQGKMVVIPHSSYVGYYPDSTSRKVARGALGIRHEEKVLVALGGVRAYKGLDSLLDVFETLSRTGPALRLLIAGRPDQSPAVNLLRERCARIGGVTVRFEYVPADEVQIWMKAADLAVLAYRDILNSGAFLLAQTFGLSVVCPRAGELRAWENRPHIWLFDPSDQRTLEKAVVEALAEVSRDPEGQRSHALAAARALPPSTMAHEYAQAVSPWLLPD